MALCTQVSLFHSCFPAHQRTIQQHQCSKSSGCARQMPSFQVSNLARQMRQMPIDGTNDSTWQHHPTFVESKVCAIATSSASGLCCKMAKPCQNSWWLVVLNMHQMPRTCFPYLIIQTFLNWPTQKAAGLNCAGKLLWFANLQQLQNFGMSATLSTIRILFDARIHNQSMKISITTHRNMESKNIWYFIYAYMSYQSNQRITKTYG